MVSEAGAYKFKKMYTDPDPTNLTWILTKRDTWSYVKILTYVLTTAPRELMSLVSIPYTLKHNALTLQYLFTNH